MPIILHYKIPFNAFSTNVPLLKPLKTSENWKFPDVFREYRSGTFVENGLIVKTRPRMSRMFWF